MWKPRPSATSDTPISSRKASASILVVGWSATNLATGPEATNITPTATITAAILTYTCPALPSTEESRVGTEGCRPWRSWLSPETQTKKKSTSYAETTQHDRHKES